ncbi:pilus assembly protein PilP [Thiohalorhabdus sp.]|uniref:pilus assembly protein PilP n=1 Tax=Thiohalorhabdus sp. TaxID=3094134 RepID=UPI002FC3B7F8
MRRWLILAAAMAALSGCGGEQDPVSDLRQMVEKPPPPPSEKKLPELPEGVEPTNVSFRPLERSPFATIPALQEAQQPEPEYTGPSPDQDREPGPLEQFALSQLEIVGTVDLPGKEWRAYVSTPDGGVHRVAPGEYMGQKHGRIEKIGPNGVVLRELVPRGEGRWEERKRTVEVKSTGG